MNEVIQCDLEQNCLSITKKSHHFLEDRKIVGWHGPKIQLLFPETAPGGKPTNLLEIWTSLVKRFWFFGLSLLFIISQIADLPSTKNVSGITERR